MRLPTDFEKPKFSTKLGKSKPSRNIWAVWADRNDIVTSNGKQLNFASRFLVVAEMEDKIHIVDENGTYNSINDEFIGEPIDFGWVPKSSMLLWSSALYSDNTNFRVKVMTIITPAQMAGELDRIRAEGKKMNFFSDPYTKKENNNELPLFEIFYVFKKDGDRLLLGKRDNISRGNADYYLLGWVDESKVQIWEMRQVLEPNWDQNSSEERRKHGVPAALFELSGEAVKYGIKGDTTRNFWSDDPYEKRFDPYWKRLPVFKRTDNLIETAVVSDLVNEKGQTINEDDFRKLKMLQSSIQEKRRNVNIVFVIDGTQSMGPYFKSVQTAVKNSALSLYNADNRFQFGSIIYRDYDDPENDKCYNTIALSSNIDRFCKELESFNTNDPACCDDTDSEGLYLGLHKATELFRGKEKESNVIILIGDAGDRKGTKRISESVVIPDLVKFRINFTALQVNHRLNQAYEDFIFQVRDMILKSSTEIVEDLEKQFGNQSILSSLTKPAWKQDNSKETGFFTLQNSPLTGGLQYVSIGKSIPVELTSRIIEKEITDMNIKTNALIQSVDNTVNSIVPIDPTKIGSFSPAVKLALKDAGYTNEQIAILTQKNYQFLLKTYTSYNVKELNNPVFAFDIFLDQDELNDLIISLNKIYIPGLTGYQRRQSFKEAWFEVLRTNYGVSRKEIENKSFSDIMKLISGLPSPNQLLTKYTYNDITDITKLPDREFDQILEIIKEKSELLTKIAGNKQFYFMSNDRAYYWIPQIYLP